jgi:cyclic pyranopterin phosphate synthase
VQFRHLSTQRQHVLTDRYGRVQDYLRISVTDRCNLRCTYCMPAEGLAWRKRDELLTDDEIVRAATLMATLGIRKIRLTGGEPTLRAQPSFPPPNLWLA